jgi:hypothetical protein
MEYLCEKCDEAVATVHLLDSDSHLCLECAERRIVVINHMIRNNTYAGLSSMLLSDAYAQRHADHPVAPVPTDRCLCSDQWMSDNFGEDGLQ